MEKVSNNNPKRPPSQESMEVNLLQTGPGQKRPRTRIVFDPITRLPYLPSASRDNISEQSNKQPLLRTRDGWW